MSTITHMINFGQMNGNKPGDASSATLTLADSYLTLAPTSNPSNLIIIHQNTLTKVLKTPDKAKPGTTPEPKKLFYILIEFYKLVRPIDSSIISSISFPLAATPPELVKDTEEKLTLAGYEKTTWFIQTTNPIDYDVSNPGLFTESPAALLKASIYLSLIALRKSQGLLQQLSTSSLTPSSHYKSTPSSSLSTSALTSTSSQLHPLYPPTSSQSTSTPTSPTHQTPNNLQITFDILNPPVTEKILTIRQKCLANDPHLKDLYDRYVDKPSIKIEKTPSTSTSTSKNDNAVQNNQTTSDSSKLFSESEFWQSHQDTFNAFCAEFSQHSIPTTTDVISQMTEFNYSYTAQHQTKGKKTQNVSNIARSTEDVTQSVRDRAKDVSRRIQEHSGLTGSLNSILAQSTSGLSISQHELKNEIKNQVKDEKTNISPSSPSNQSSFSHNSTVNGQNDMQNSFTPTFNLHFEKKSALKGSLYTQQLLGDDIGWGNQGEYQKHLDSADMKTIDVKSKERIFLAKNMITGLNLLGQAETNTNKEDLLTEHSKFIQNNEIYDKLKQTIYADDMSKQLDEYNSTQETHIITSNVLQKSQKLFFDKTVKEKFEKNEDETNQPNQQNVTFAPSTTCSGTSSFTGITMPQINNLIDNGISLIPTMGENTNDLQNDKLIKTETTTTTTANTPALTSPSPEIETQELHLHSTKYSTHTPLTLKFTSKQSKKVPNLHKHDQDNFTNNGKSISTQDLMKQVNEEADTEYSSKYHELPTELIIQTTNNSLQNGLFLFPTAYLATIHTGIHLNTLHDLNKRKEPMQEADDALESLWDSTFISKRRQLAMSSSFSHSLPSTSTSPLINDSNNENTLVALEDINPIADLLHQSIPSSATTFSIFAATTTNQYSTFKNPHSNSASTMSSGNTGSDKNSVQAFLLKSIQPKLNQQVEDCLRTVHEISTHYWSLAQKSVKIFHPNQSMKSFSEALLEQLAKLSLRLTSIGQHAIPKFSAHFTREDKSHLVQQLTFAQAMINSVYIHYKRLDPDLLLHRKVQQDDAARKQLQHQQKQAKAMANK